MRILCTVAVLLGCAAANAKTSKQVSYGTTLNIEGQMVKIEFYAPSIVRVTKAPGTLPQKGSYSVILTPGEGMNEAVIEGRTDNTQTLSSSLLSVAIDEQTGQIIFCNHEGKKLIVDKGTTFAPCQHEVDKGKYSIEQHFTIGKDEALFGLGQLRDKAMNQRGRDIDIWNSNTYISIPYFTSEQGYGIYWDNAGKSRFTSPELGEEGPVIFTSEVGVCADYYVIYKDGTQDGVIAGIRQLTGQATMFPLWAMGHWQCRERYKTSDELADVLDTYRELQIPLDAIVQDWQYWGCDSNWNAMRFMNPYYINKVGDPAWEKYLPGDMKNMNAQANPRLKSPEEMVRYVHDHHAHLMISIWPDFGPWTEQHAKLKEMQALLPFDTWPMNAGAQIYDVFNPAARGLYWQYLTHLYDMGFDAWWTDSTEPDEFYEEEHNDYDYMTYDGSWRSVKNAFPLLHNQSIYEHQRATKGGNARRSVQMTRSGALGLQHYGTFSWSGDIIASWDEMKQQIPSGLNYTLCGIPFWNTDLGGFFYWDFIQDPKNPAIQELQTRWMEWGAFMPLMRNHCSSPMVSEIYRMGKEGDWCYDAIKAFIQLRYRLLPYIYSTAGDCVQNSGSMMRPFVMDFATDRKALLLNDEYMFGRSLLVKPVTDAMYTWKDENKWGHETYPDIRQASCATPVYLPQGTQWYDFWTNELLEGGRSLMRPCPIDIIPVYVKAGSILPFGPDVQYSDEKTWDDLEIRVYPGADGAFTLYEDEGDNYNYEKGRFTQIPFIYDDTTSTLTIGTRRGSYKGMLTHRTFRIVLVDKNSGSGHQPMTGGKSVQYNGKEIQLKLR